jgi:lysophospholipase L1-like esterase
MTIISRYKAGLRTAASLLFAKRYSLMLCFVAVVQGFANAQSSKQENLRFFAADSRLIQYTGRIDFSNPLLPRFWQPGTYFNCVFTGTACQVIVTDQVLWGKNHNYLEVVVDGVAKRIQTRSAQDTITVAAGLKPGTHSLLVCKNTEANIGYLELVGIRCKQLLPPPKKPSRKIEFIGNSITCGTGVDQTLVPCGKGAWQDQHNAYMSYGPLIARSLNAQWMLSAVSGIGLVRSCCNMDVLMPQVFDNIEMRGDSISWDFKNYQPDVVTICLGQNDGIQDSVLFCSAYVQFIHQVRSHYPTAQIILLNSPMADEALTTVLKKYLTAISGRVRKEDKKVAHYFYAKRYHLGCDSHPDMREHQQMAKELGLFIRNKMRW